MGNIHTLQQKYNKLNTKNHFFFLYVHYLNKGGGNLKIKAYQENLPLMYDYLLFIHFYSH